MQDRQLRPAQVEKTLLLLAIVFVATDALALTLAPAARAHSWVVEYRWAHWLGVLMWGVGVELIRRQLQRRLPEHDSLLLPTAALLTGWGLVTIYRLDVDFGYRQTLWMGVVIVTSLVLLQFSNLLNFLRRYKYLFLMAGLGLMALTLFIGSYPGGNGPRLWLGCCGLYLQPSEPLKLLLVVFLAAYLADRGPVTPGLISLLAPTLIVTVSALALLLVHRDLGATSLLLVLFATVVYLAAGKRRILLGGAGLLLGGGLAGYFLFDVVRLRVEAWLNPWADPSGRSYQIVQSLISVAAGGVIGRGPGMGSPSVVPVAHSDFIFTAIAEEFGLTGGLGLLLLVAFLVLAGFRVALKAPNTFRRLLAAGITVFLTAQSILIIGGNLRLLPLTGVTLPFVSYGGSSLLTSWVSVVLLLYCSATNEEPPAPLPQTLPYRLIPAGLLAGLVGIFLAMGWWTTIRSDELVSRTDNPRRAISDRFVPRGALLDRSNRAIAVTNGEPSQLTRIYEQPYLAHVVGYNNPTYGQAALEQALDSYLRGMQGNPSSLIWWSHLVYGQPPNGLDVRLSLDLDLAQKANDLLTDGDHKGAVVALNAVTGEVLAMVSTPGFDPNHLEENWSALVADAASPLVNRAIQGQYPAGPVLGPFLLQTLQDENYTLPENTPSPLWLEVDGQNQVCAQQPEDASSWAEAAAYGCPAALQSLSRLTSATQLRAIITQLGLDQQPSGLLEVAPPKMPAAEASAFDMLVGNQQPRVTPLQMALAAAAISSGGSIPEPQYATAVSTLQQGWVVLSGASPRAALSPESANAIAENLSMRNAPYWRSTAVAYDGAKPYTWVLAGTQPNWQGTPLAIAVLVEGESLNLGDAVVERLLVTP